MSEIDRRMGNQMKFILFVYVPCLAVAMLDLVGVCDRTT
jgi:hypothetical protein